MIYSYIYILGKHEALIRVSSEWIQCTLSSNNNIVRSMLVVVVAIIVTMAVKPVSVSAGLVSLTRKRDAFNASRYFNY